jgi:hypothetical protein
MSVGGRGTGKTLSIMPGTINRLLNTKKKKGPEYRAKLNKRSREYRREKRKDPEYRAKFNEQNRAWLREKMKDPVYRAKFNERRSQDTDVDFLTI